MNNETTKKVRQRTQSATVSFNKKGKDDEFQVVSTEKLSSSMGAGSSKVEGSNQTKTGPAQVLQ